MKPITSMEEALAYKGTGVAEKLLAGVEPRCSCGAPAPSPVPVPVPVRKATTHARVESASQKQCCVIS